ncbi:hypothetical protein BM533_21145, partial [Clostridioides difficile]
EDIVKYLRENVKDNDLVITAGAGPIYKVADLLVEKIIYKNNLGYQISNLIAFLKSYFFPISNISFLR